MTNNGKGKVFTLPVILHIISQIVMIISMVCVGLIMKEYINTGEIFLLIVGLLILLIGSLAINCEISTFTEFTKRKIYKLILNAIISYIFFILVIFAIILKNIFLVILAIIVFVVPISISFMNEFKK